MPNIQHNKLIKTFQPLRMTKNTNKRIQTKLYNEHSNMGVYDKSVTFYISLNTELILLK